MSQVKFYLGEDIPLELHKVRVVQKLHLVPIERRLDAIKEAGFNTFRLSTLDVYLDMLTDSGTNAMSDNQVASMLQADDAYAGSQSFIKLQKAVEDVLGKKYLLPVHQGRAAENVICRAFIKKGDIIPTNYHFTTVLAHVLENGGKIEELLHDHALVLHSDHPFKGNMDIEKLEACIQKHGVDKIPFIRMEASTNLIGGQPFSMSNLMDVRRVADKYGIMLVLDASLLGENAYLIQQREEQWKENSMADIIKMMTGLADLVYFSARKLSSSRGGGICTNRKDLYGKMEALIPLFEGFLTYGGISVREIGDGRRFARDARRDDDQPESVVYQIPSRIARQARYSGSDPSGRVGSPRGCDGFLSAHSADRIPRRRAGSRVLPDFGYPRNGTGDHIERPGRERRRDPGRRGTVASGRAAPRVHAVAGQVRDRPPGLVV